MATSRRAWLSITLALACGLILRIVMVHHFALVAGDALVYGRLAANLLQHGVYAMGDQMLRPTLIRLPGYPIFIALVFRIFGVANYTAVLSTQIFVDLLSCWLIFVFVRDRVSTSAALIALWIAALCPFTATYVAAPLTETLSIFCVALALLAASRCLQLKFTSWIWNVALAFALAYAILLRPDGGLLAAAVIGWLAWHLLRRPGPFRGFFARRLAVISLLTLLPLAPWTIRNWRVFHVIQPLAPRYANDPGELPESGYKLWTKTWFADAVSNEEFYWCADDCPLDINLLPSRAFDSAEQKKLTETLLDDVNDGDSVTPEVDARFAALAAERSSQHRWLISMGLPTLRLADMWLRPRTELFPVPMRWWEYRQHPKLSLFAAAYALLNAALLVFAIVGFLKHRVPLAGMMLAYICLRCLLLLTLENAETRYTLECFPMLIIAAACALALRNTTDSPQSSSSSSSR